MKTKFNNSTIQQFNNRGFTLLELVVVFSVIAVISTIGVASFVSYSRSQTLQQATNDFVTTLNTAKAKSASQNKPIQCAGTVLSGYSVAIDIVGKKYTLNVNCVGQQPTVLKRTPLPPGVSFNSATGTPPTTTPSVFFSVLTGGVVGTGNIVLSAYGSYKTVTINSVGGIQ